MTTSYKKDEPFNPSPARNSDSLSMSKLSQLKSIAKSIEYIQK